MSNADDIIKIRQLIPEHRIAMVTTQAPSGELHSRPLKTQEIDDSGSFWFIVSAEAEWVGGVTANSPINLGFTDEDDKTWVSVAGTALLAEDDARVDRYTAGGDVERIDPAAIRLLVVDPSTSIGMRRPDAWKPSRSRRRTSSARSATLRAPSRCDATPLQRSTCSEQDRGHRAPVSSR